VAAFFAENGFLSGDKAVLGEARNQHPPPYVNGNSNGANSANGSKRNSVAPASTDPHSTEQAEVKEGV